MRDHERPSEPQPHAQANPPSDTPRTTDDLRRALFRHGIACDDDRAKRMEAALAYVDAMVRTMRLVKSLTSLRPPADDANTASNDGPLPVRGPDGSWMR